MRPAPALLLAVLALAATPLASAQVPDPEAVVALACATAGGVDPALDDAVPLCPRDEPAAPQQAEEEDAHEHDAAAPPGSGDPQDAADLAGQALDDAQAIPQDPASAPNRLAALAATVVQFVRDLVGLPAQALDATASFAQERWAALDAAVQDARDGAADAAASAREAVVGAAEGARQAALGVLDAVKSLLDRPDAPALPRGAPRAPSLADDDARGLLDAALAKLPL